MGFLMVDNRGRYPIRTDGLLLVRQMTHPYFSIAYNNFVDSEFSDSSMRKMHDLGHEIVDLNTIAPTKLRNCNQPGDSSRSEHVFWGWMCPYIKRRGWISRAI